MSDILSPEDFSQYLGIVRLPSKLVDEDAARLLAHDTALRAERDEFRAKWYAAKKDIRSIAEAIRVVDYPEGCPPVYGGVDGIIAAIEAGGKWRDFDRDEVEKLRAERDRYREALEEASLVLPHAPSCACVSGCAFVVGPCNCVHSRIGELLEGKP